MSGDSNRDLRSAANCIIRVCEKEGETVSESLAIFTLRLLSFNPDLEESIEKKDLDQKIKEVTELSIKTLLNQCDPCSLTLKLQVYFDLNYRSASEFLAEHEAVYDRTIQPVLKKIVNFTSAAGTDYRKLHNEIIKFTMLHEIVDQKQDPQTYKEVEKAVTSVLPVSDLCKFVDLAQQEKKDYLYTLAPVAVGIRLFSWQEGKVQSTINDIPSIAAGCAPKLAIDFLHEIEEVEKLIKCIQEILYHYYFFEGTDSEWQLNLTYLPPYLAFLQQYQAFLYLMLKECKAMTYRILSLENCYRSIIQRLKVTISSTSAPATLLFSLYSDVSNVWKALKNELLFLHSLLTIFRNIKVFKKRCRGNYSDAEIKDLWSDFSEKGLLEKEKLLTGTTGISKHDADYTKLDDTNMEPVEVVFDSGHLLKIPSSGVKNLEEVHLKLEGYCPWAIVHGKGLLLPGNRYLGIVQFHGCCYAFCCTDALENFSTNPDFYLNSVVMIVRQQPQLIVLLNLMDEFDLDMDNRNVFEKKIVPPILISHRSCQTELHPFKTNYDPNYEWNLWILRKQAIQYANIRTKRTHSMQTLRSYFRRENFTQVYLPKNNVAQTKRDASTETMKAGMPEIKFQIKTSIF